MLQNVKGTKDILPGQISKWQYIEDVIRKETAKFGYVEYRTPIFEKTEVFSRSIGENTDIVNKEMYTFADKGGDSVTLRPEMTAALVRSVLQHNLHSLTPTQRYWYFGPFFRYERPQKGRLRQFHQFGAECISSPNPESDYEIILLADYVSKALGINDYTLKLNSLGNIASREKYREALIRYFSSVRSSLSADSQNRLEINPLRVLDSKAPEDIEAAKGSPNILDFLDTESRDHFELVIKLLKQSGIEPEICPRLVRGLDYYSHTVFEFQSSALGAQDSFGGGGRYNELFQEFGGKPNPAVGFAMGVERMLIILDALDKYPGLSDLPDVYVVSGNTNLLPYINRVVNILRNKGLRTLSDLQRKSMKSQFREANKAGVKFVVVVGVEEFENEKVQIKNMAGGEQIEIGISELAEYDF